MNEKSLLLKMKIEFSEDNETDATYMICGCCKYFHLGVRDRCDKGNNWVLTDGICQDFER